MPSGNLTGFKALIIAQKYGGESNFAKFIPITDPRYTVWYNARPSHRFTLPQLAATALNSEFAIHPDYLELMAQWNAGDMAIIPNCGPLVVPLPTLPPPPGTPIPGGIGAHDTFQQHIDTLGANLYPTARGWLGAVADIVSPFVGNSGAARSLAVANGGFAIKGSDTTPFALPGAGGLNVTFSNLGNGGATIRDAILLAVNRSRGTNSNPRIENYQKVFSAAVAGATFFNPVQVTAIGAGGPLYEVDAAFSGVGGGSWRNQFWRIARVIEDAVKNRNGGLGSRLVVACSFGDYDMHGSEAPRFTVLAQDYAAALRDFRTAMTTIGQWNNVVVSDLGDFGRTLWTNGGDGTDHAFGQCIFLHGGQVRGKGKDGSNGLPGPAFPATISTNRTGSRDWDTGGLLTPDASLEEVYDDILDWFGLTLADRQAMMPNRGNFSNFINTMV